MTSKKKILNKEIKITFEKGEKFSSLKIPEDNMKKMTKDILWQLFRDAMQNLKVNGF